MEAFVQNKTDLEQTHDRLIEVTADITDIQRVDCTVQVVVESANKSVHAHQVFANFRWEKSTEVNEHGLSPEEATRIDQDGEEDGWINIREAQCLQHLIKEAIDAKLCIERYAKSRAIEAKLYVENYANIASMAIESLRMNHVREHSNIT